MLLVNIASMTNILLRVVYIHFVWFEHWNACELYIANIEAGVRCKRTCKPFFKPCHSRLTREAAATKIYLKLEKN